MCEVEHAIFYPAGFSAVALLAKSGVDASLALLSFLHEGILLAFRLCLTSGAAVIDTPHISFVFVAEIVPIYFVAGHHLRHYVLFEHVSVCQWV